MSAHILWRVKALNSEAMRRLRELRQANAETVILLADGVPTPV
jgi:hypothetical protein